MAPSFQSKTHSDEHFNFKISQASSYQSRSERNRSQQLHCLVWAALNFNFIKRCWLRILCQRHSKWKSNWFGQLEHSWGKRRMSLFEEKFCIFTAGSSGPFVSARRSHQSLANGDAAATQRIHLSSTSSPLRYVKPIKRAKIYLLDHSTAQCIMYPPTQRK